MDKRKNQQGQSEDQGQKGGQSSRTEDQDMENTDYTTEDTDRGSAGDL